MNVGPLVYTDDTDWLFPISNMPRCASAEYRLYLDECGAYELQWI